MKRYLYIILLATLSALPAASYACTSAIIPGWATPDGRPLLWKHRDTGTLDNRLEHFKGEKYAFVGLVNSPSEGGEVWIGSNTAGFAIMNTASYCLKDDDVPACDMDREGFLMYRALEICATLEDFEHFLDTLSRPMGVEANFGCIDAFGGAAYYETDNDGWFKRDVDAMQEGYCVVTNFSVTGRPEDWKGVERFRTADAVMSRQSRSEGRFDDMSPYFLMDSLSRSYEHQGDSLFIPRYITSSSVAVRGVREGESADKSVIYTALGYPDCSVMIPVPVSEEDHIPACLRKGSGTMNCEACDFSLSLKYSYIFMEGRNGPTDFTHTEELAECARKAEKRIRRPFERLFESFRRGRIDAETYTEKYDRMSEKWMNIIYKEFYTYHK